MRRGYQDTSFLTELLEKMCQKAESDMHVPQKFDIFNLMTKEEEELATTCYGHIHLGQRFSSLVDTGKIKGITKTGKKTKRGCTEYKRN